VHVDDLSRAHIAAFDQLGTPGTQLFYNLGTGRPPRTARSSAPSRRSSASPSKSSKAAPPGDPPALYADSTKARRELGWQVKFGDIESIVATAWRWHSSHPQGYADR
jgi:UDP-glucose 4-epimerase